MNSESSDYELIRNGLLCDQKNGPIASVAQIGSKRNYVNAELIEELAIKIYKTKSGNGTTYQDLMDAGLVLHKKQAQKKLKYHMTKGTLFTLKDTRPQQYYPSTIKSEIVKNVLQRNGPINPTGVALQNPHVCKSPLVNCSYFLEDITIQTLESYVLPLLPKAPLFIHNMHFKTKVSPECYTELKLSHYKKNKGKYHTEIIGNTHVDYVFYSCGTVNINTKCSKNPHKLETAEDKSRIMAFFGQIRDRLIVILYDKHERLVPDIMEWYLTEFDINKDIKVSDLFHYAGTKIQVKHLDHLFSLYIKSMGKDTVFRLEERKHPNNKSPIEVIDEIFNPIDKIEKRLNEIEQKIINAVITRSFENNNKSS